MTFRTISAAIIVFAALGSLAPSGAAAQGGFYLGGGLGPAVRVDDWPTQFRLEQEIGYYFSGRPEGFFLGFAPSQSFGDDTFIVTFAPRVGYMFNIYRSRGLAFQLGPAGTIPGIAIAGCYDGRRCDADPYFHFSFSFMMRLLIANERVALYLRPLEFEFAFGDGVDPPRDIWPGDAIRYVLSGGVQFHL